MITLHWLRNMTTVGVNYLGDCMRYVNFLVFIFSFLSVGKGQVELSDMADMIDLSKKSAVPILCRDSTWPSSLISAGTAVILGDGERLCSLTCEHVIAIKDSLNRTVRYVSDIRIHMNRLDSTAMPFPVGIIYSDEQNDFAILAIPKDLHDSLNSIHLKIITPSQWLETNQFREGEPLIYLGYPMFMGIDKQNCPLSRSGMVSQIIPGRSFFLIDGFVQHGHSGSPVFLMRSNEKGIVRYLTGITRGFPEEFADIVQETTYKKETKRKTIVNPGFTVVTAMDVIIPVLKQLGFNK
jgi:hypothetical protein